MSTIGQPAVSTRCIQAMVWQARVDAQQARRTGNALKERLATRRMDAMLDELAKRLGLDSNLHAEPTARLHARPG